MRTPKIMLAGFLFLAAHLSCSASCEEIKGEGEDKRTATQRLYTPRPLEDYPLCFQKLDIPDQKRHQMFLDSRMGTRYKKQFEPYYASTEGIKDDPELAELVERKPMLLTKEEYPEVIQELEVSDQERHIIHLSSNRCFYRPHRFTEEELDDSLIFSPMEAIQRVDTPIIEIDDSFFLDPPDASQGAGTPNSATQN